MSEELKPCPFCGGEAVLEDKSGTRSPPFSVRCAAFPGIGKCHCELWPQDTVEEAIEQWNTRTPPAVDLDEDTEAFLVIDSIAHPLNRDDWADEFRDFYKPEKWLNPRRAACAFIVSKLEGHLRPKVDWPGSREMQASYREYKKRPYNSDKDRRDIHDAFLSGYMEAIEKIRKMMEEG